MPQPKKLRLILGDQLNENQGYRIGNAQAEHKPRPNWVSSFQRDQDFIATQKPGHERRIVAGEDRLACRLEATLPNPLE